MNTFFKIWFLLQFFFTSNHWIRHLSQIKQKTLKSFDFDAKKDRIEGKKEVMFFSPVSALSLNNCKRCKLKFISMSYF